MTIYWCKSIDKVTHLKRQYKSINDNIFVLDNGDTFKALM